MQLTFTKQLYTELNTEVYGVHIQFGLELKLIETRNLFILIT